MKERRKLPRKYLMVYSRVFNRETGQIIGYLSDLNHLGAMLISDDPQLVGADLPLRFDLPEPHLSGQSRLSLDARVAWCSPDIDPAFFNLGLTFREVNETQSRIIQMLMETYEFRRNTPPLSGPFPLEDV